MVLISNTFFYSPSSPDLPEKAGRTLFAKVPIFGWRISPGLTALKGSDYLMINGAASLSWVPFLCRALQPCQEGLGTIYICKTCHILLHFTLHILIHFLLYAAQTHTQVLLSTPHPSACQMCFAWASPTQPCPVFWVKCSGNS